MTSIIRILAVGLAAAFSIAPASAGFRGQTIEATAHFPDFPGTTTAGPIDKVVGAGIEFNDGEFTPFFGPSFDFDDTTILITHAQTGHTGATFNGYQFNDILGTLADIVVVSIISDSSGFFSGDPSRITWDANNIFINFQGLSFSGVDDPRILLGVAFGEVPLPGALPLFISALAGFGFFGGRKNRKAAA